MSEMKSENLNTSIIASLIVILMLMGCGSDDSNSKESEGSELTIQEVLNNAVSSGVDGIFLHVEKNGEQATKYSSGVENREENTPANANSLFKIASISKLFVAVSAIKLDALGSLNLDDTLAFWLPEISARIENGDNITIRDMLSHRSGIPDFDSQQGFSWQQAHFDPDITLEYALDLPADFQPDSQYEYSNTNYLLVGKILDQSLGYSHRVFVQEAILTPLGLGDTYSSTTDIDTDRLVKGYWENSERSEQTYDITGGSMVSTVADVGLFLRELNSVNLLFTSQEKQSYDLVYFNQHTGWLPGYQSIARITAVNGTVIVLFVNTTGSGSEAVISSTYDKIIRLL